MEALERLQSVHAMLRLMRDHSLCPCELDDLSSDRFLAEFFLFLIQTCAADAIELKRKCDKLMNQLPKVSTTFLQALVVEKCILEASRSSQDAVEGPVTGSKAHLEKNTMLSPSIPSISKEAGEHVDTHKSMIISAENMHDVKSQTRNSPSSDMAKQRTVVLNMVPLVGLKAMERANTSLEDFCRSYFMFHGMDVHNPQHLFKHLPILSFVEAFIYQLDEENEEQLQLSNNSTVAVHGHSDYRSARNTQAEACTSEERTSQDATHIKTSRSRDKNHSQPCLTGLGTQPFSGLQHVLAMQGLLTERIESEFRDGVEYWRLEQVLCASATKGYKVTAEDVLRAIKLKSFDYRVLNLLLYSLTGREVNEAHFEFLAVSELLVEISDDLFDYEDDVLKNSFNVLRMLLKVYGPRKAPEMLAKLISEEEMKYQHLLEGLEPSLRKQYQERCKEATFEGGGSTSKNRLGSWTIPPLIVNETEYRAQLQC